MKRYINAERLKMTFASGIRVYDGMCKIDDVMHNIDNEPTADVVEVVRCENCKHIKVANSPTVYAYCRKTKFLFEPFQTDTRTHFCSFGERRGDEQ